MKAAILAAVFLLACTKPNPAVCTSASDCNNGQVCDPETNRCVGVPDARTTCTSNDECGPVSPICGADMACRGCELDDECTSGICRSDGTCEAAENVLYVSPNGISAGTCPSSAPCEIFYARSLVNEDRYSLRLANGTYVLNADFTVSGATTRLVMVGGRGAAVQRPATGPSIEVVGATLNIRGVTINKGLRCANATLEIARVGFDNAVGEVRPWIDGLNCTLSVENSVFSDSLADGIFASSGRVSLSKSKIERSAGNGIRLEQGSKATVEASTIDRNALIGATSVGGLLAVHRSIITLNRRGGLSSTFGTFDVTNNYVAFNGDPGASGFGGLRLDSMQSGNRVQHNTIIRNDCDVNVSPILAGGIFCRGATASNNLVANNFRGNTMLENAQTGGDCSYTGSYVNESDAGLALASDGFHLTAGSSAAINAGSNSGVTVDIDGDPRSDGMADIGADELAP